uniref:Phytanoyl-CoA dioxygenase n=1 Tax=Helicotheca tamesis TaxID=374047 RepID=A0A7S2HMX0_9STRA
MNYSIIEGKLTPENKTFYKDQGYLIAPDVLESSEVDKLNQEVIAIGTGKLGNFEGLADAENLSDEEIIKKYAAIHFPHKISGLMKEYAGHQYISEILSGIVSPNVKCLQTMYFIKAPGKKGQAWHQDEYFIPTRDRSLTGAWMALDDADVENGCLWVIPGSHKDGYIRQRIKNDDDSFADVEGTDLAPYTAEDFVKVEVKKGSVVFFNGYLLHMSRQNLTKNRFRRALVCHYSSAETMLPWDLDGRIDPTRDFRDIFIVAGKDPYAYKGTEDLIKPFIRPDVLDFNTKEGREKLKEQKG